ncbi:MAG: response regulator transcription factor [Cyanobacteria bacterium J06642_11]
MIQNYCEKFVVADDHTAILDGTCLSLRTQYRDAQITTTTKAYEVETLVETIGPDVLIMDLSMPEKGQETACTETGLNVLRSLFKKFPDLNIVVQTVHGARLIRLKPSIDRHQGGFIIADKSLSQAEMLVKVGWAMHGLLYTPPEMRVGLEIKPEWLELLKLAFIDGLTDRAISERMHRTERCIRHYWRGVQNALEVYPDKQLNLRVQTYNKARHIGMLD